MRIINIVKIGLGPQQKKSISNYYVKTPNSSRKEHY